jgi:hypothetical protein
MVEKTVEPRMNESNLNDALNTDKRVFAVSEVDTKPFFASQTFWGGIAAIGAGIGSAYMAYKVGNMEGVMAGMTAAGGGLAAVIGRFKATRALIK